MISKGDINIIGASFNEEHKQLTVAYDAINVGIVHDVIDVTFSGKKVNIESDVILTLGLPKEEEKELILAIIDAVEDYIGGVL